MRRWKYWMSRSIFGEEKTQQSNESTLYLWLIFPEDRAVLRRSQHLWLLSSWYFDEEVSSHFALFFLHYISVWTESSCPCLAEDGGRPMANFWMSYFAPWLDKRGGGKETRKVCGETKRRLLSKSQWEKGTKQASSYSTAEFPGKPCGLEHVWVAQREHESRVAET